ncbi:hypothetical protein QCA50_004498 [Cerrena zonata]|uniref:Uncharacterized protein n=1 Tax=Cerrena zonata TaxID=2478898 RepID=A0AAW0GGY8_9APHY
MLAHHTSVAVVHPRLPQALIDIATTFYASCHQESSRYTLQMFNTHLDDVFLGSLLQNILLFFQRIFSSVLPLSLIEMYAILPSGSFVNVTLYSHQGTIHYS